jgi:uncharacterized membrane protein YfcA
LLSPDIIIGGIVIGLLLGLTGSGGSILTVPLLIYGVGLDPKVAIATSLVIVGSAAICALLQHHRNKHVRWRIGIVFGLSGMVGAYLGGRIGESVSEGSLLLLFSCVMFASGISMIHKHSALETGGDSCSVGHRARNRTRSIAEGFIVGLVTGLVGAGGGFLIVPALVLFAGLPMHLAVGTSLLVISMKCIAAFAGYFTHVVINWEAALSVGLFAAMGTLLGSRLSQRLDAVCLQKVFGYFVLVVSVVIASIEFVALIVKF